jgi:hypothetical protein
MFVMAFPELMPPTLIRATSRDQGVRAEQGDIVMKPLYGKVARRCSASRADLTRLAHDLHGHLPRAVGGAEILPR